MFTEMVVCTEIEHAYRDEACVRRYNVYTEVECVYRGEACVQRWSCVQSGMYV